MQRILIVCTSNLDRSPALEKYLKEAYPGNIYRSAGVNKYFCQTKGTNYISQEDIDWCDVIAYAEDIHKEAVEMKFPSAKLEAMEKLRQCIVLNCGDYRQGCIGEDWLTRAEEKLKPFLI